MIRIQTGKTDFMKILNFIILFDLIIGGSGRLIMIGSLSARTLLFAFVMMYTLIYIIVNRVSFEGKTLALIMAFIIYLVINVIIVGNKPYSVKFDFLSRYLYIVLVFFYEIYFTKYNAEETIETTRCIFEKITFLFAIFSILLWIYAFLLGRAAYSIIELGFFRPKVYGSFDFISGRIPRIFMKSSIFVPVGLLFNMDRFIDEPSMKKFVRCGIYAVAIITTFTTGFYLATAICCFLLLHRKRVMTRKISIFIVIILAAAAFAVIRSGLISVMLERYTGDYSTSYRSIQLASIIKTFLKKPLFGQGFGYEFTTVYGNSVRTTSGFEIAYGETLVDTGIIGFVLYMSIIGLTLWRLFRFSKYSSTIYVFALSLILICLESLTNPFINNAIGLTFFAVCTGIGNTLIRTGDCQSFFSFYRNHIKYRGICQKGMII